MKYKYVATNVISVRTPEERNKYLDLCFEYFYRAGRPSLPEEFMDRDIIERNKLREKICPDTEAKCDKPRLFYLAKLKEGASLENFSLFYTTNLGFLENIIYDAKEECFKLRLFAEESLEKRNLDILYESMRNWLASSPEKLGLEVHQQIEDSIEPITTPVSWDDIRYYHWNQLIEGIQINEGIANMELLDPKSYECGAEERMGYLEDKDNAEAKLRILKTEQKYFSDTNYMDLLKSKADLFKQVRDKFILKFPELREEFEGTAFGSFPLIYLLDSPAMKAHTESFLPVESGGFENQTLSFLNAKIIERPVSTNCKHIMSFYPYTSPTEELNELYAESLKDDEIMRGLFAHEFGEIVMEQRFAPVYYNFFDMLINRAYATGKKREHVEQGKQRHEEIENLMVEMGYKKETEKLHDAFREVAKRVIEQDGISHPDYWNFLRIIEAHEEGLEFLARQAA